jgi:LuxR family maltose regulon positive regulatory protein
LPFASEAYLGLARVLYERNDLDGAEQYAQQSIELARQIENTDRVVAGELMFARLKLARGDAAGAAITLDRAGQIARRYSFVQQMDEIAATQVMTLLRQGNLDGAAELAQAHELPMSRARVHLARRDTAAALALLEPMRREAEAKGWEEQRLRVLVLEALADHARGEKDKALELLGDALARAAPAGFIRLFVDESAPMDQLLSEAAANGIMPDYVGRLLAVFEAEDRKTAASQQKGAGRDPKRAGESSSAGSRGSQPLIEPLSQRELEVLRLIAEGLSNREISERLFVAVITVKGHNQRIFGKLQVQRRTEAVARARELGLL